MDKMERPGEEGQSAIYFLVTGAIFALVTLLGWLGGRGGF